MNESRQRGNKIRNYSDEVNRHNKSGWVSIQLSNHHCTEGNNISMFHGVQEKNRPQCNTQHKFLTSLQRAHHYECGCT